MHQGVYSPVHNVQCTSRSCLIILLGSHLLELSAGLPLWHHMWHESQGYDHCSSRDLLRATCLYRWSSWSISASQKLAAPLPPFWNALFRAPSNPPVPLCWLRQVKKTTRLALLDLLQQSPSVCQGLAWGGLARAGCDLFLSHSWPVVTHGKPTAFASKSSMWIIIYFQNIWCATFPSDRSFDTSK